MNRSGAGDQFEPWLERELRRLLAMEQTGGPRAAPAAYRTASVRRVAGPGVKSALAVAVVTLAAFGAGGVALATGGPNPVGWARDAVVAATRRAPAPVDAPDSRASAPKPTTAAGSPAGTEPSDATKRVPANRSVSGGGQQQNASGSLQGHPATSTAKPHGHRAQPSPTSHN